MNKPYIFSLKQRKCGWKKRTENIFSKKNLLNVFKFVSVIFI